MMGLYPEPIELEGAELDFRLQTKPFKLDIGRFDLFDQGQTRHAFGSLTAEPSGWRVALDGRADWINPARIVALWPERVVTKTRDWLNQNILSGQFRNVDFALRIAPDSAPHTYLAFDYEEATFKPLKDLPPVTDAWGHASFDGARFVVSLDRGSMAAGQGGSLQIERSAFIIPDTAVKGGAPAVVRFNARGPVPAVLWTLDQPPMGMMRRAGLPVDLASGDMALSGTLSFPLKLGEGAQAVTFDVTGDLTDLSSNDLIKGRLLRAKQMALTASNTRVTIEGSGTLDGVAFDGRWQQPLGQGAATSALQASVQITPQALDAFNVALPPGAVQGEMRADIAVDFARGQPPQMRIRSDLKGARLQIPQLGWAKPGGTTGALDMRIRLGAAPAITAMTFSGAGLSAAGQMTLAPTGGLERMELDALRVGDWLDVRAALVGQGPGSAPQVVVRGGTLDLRRAQFGTGAATGPPAPPMRITLDRLQITDTIWLQGLTGTFTTTGSLEGLFEARVNGGTGVSGRVVAQRGRMAVRLSSADAGGVLRSAGLMQQVVGGALDVSLLPVGSGDAYDGLLKVNGVSIRNAPTMATLVNAISVVGLVNEMSGDGIYFDEVEAEFRMTPGRITLSRGSALGASLGLSADGVFASDTGQISMQGVITPVYLLNGIGAVLTRKGEGLLGFNYAITGSVKAPQVSINPLSVLAPGGLRDMLRAPKTQVPMVEGEAVPPAASPAGESPVEPVYEGR